MAIARRERVAVRLDQAAAAGGALEVHELVADERASLDARLDALEALELVGALPPRQRRLFPLQIAGLTYAEMSALTGDSVRTVDRQLRRAHAQVRHTSPG